MNHSNGGGETEPTDITKEWLQLNYKCVQWQAPVYASAAAGADGARWFQTCVVQGLNSAGRQAKNRWYCVSRCGGGEQEVTLKVHSQFETLELATHYQQTLERELSGGGGCEQWVLQSPYLRAFCRDDVSTRWSRGVDEHTANKIVKQKHVVCVQAAMTMNKNVLYAWSEADTDYVQMYEPATDSIVNTEPRTKRIYGVLQAILRERPNIVLVGVVNTKSVFYIYDVIAFPCDATTTTRRVEFTHQPLLDRLRHLQAIVTSVGGGQQQWVKVAPFQAATTKQELRLHTQIFTDSCDFPDVIRRVSGASGE